MMYVVDQRRCAPTTDPGDVLLAVSVQRHGSHATVQIHGSFTQAAGERVNEMLKWLLETGARDIHVELDHLADTSQYRGQQAGAPYVPVGARA